VATWCCVQRSCIKVKTDETAFAQSVPAISRSSLQLDEFKREDPWQSTRLNAATKSRSYLMSSSVANHGIGIKKTGPDLVHWQVFLLFNRVWHVCTILGNKCQTMQYLSMHSKPTILNPEARKQQVSHGLSRSLAVSHGLPQSLTISLYICEHLFAAE
jgi:hypothetical protein